jgi:hypothetical protein
MAMEKERREIPEGTGRGNQESLLTSEICRGDIPGFFEQLTSTLLIGGFNK